MSRAAHVQGVVKRGDVPDRIASITRVALPALELCP